MVKRILGTAVLLLALPAAGSPATLQVTLIPQVSDAHLWRFEVINDSVDTLDVIRLVATFSVGGQRLWSQPVYLNPSLLRPGEAGWITLDPRFVPNQRVVDIDWDLTWNPHRVPVVESAWRTERVASSEVERGVPSASVAPAVEPAPRSRPPLQPWDGDRWLF